MIDLVYRAGDALRRAAKARDDGLLGEDVAHRYLRDKGCTVMARNYRTRSGSGEVDLVAFDENTLVFVEVKTRGSEEFGQPEQAVDAEKQERLRRAARDYARRAGVEWERTRFDIVSIVVERPKVRIRWIKDAFR
jgi:putative endonuclease